MTTHGVAGRLVPETPAPDAAAGRPIVLTYTNATAEYAALYRGAGVVDRSQRLRLRVSGPRAAEMLGGLVTNDTAALASGQGQYAAALSPKGKIVADVRLFVQEGGVLTDTGARAGAGWMATVRKYVNPRLAPYVDETESTRCLGVFGPAARHVVEAMTGVNASALTVLSPYAHVGVEMDGVPVTVARGPELPVEGFELFLPSALFDDLWSRAVAAGALPVGLSAWEIARVEAGRPEWGLDMDESTLVQEANLDTLQAVSYTKGCYVGQEVVARVHFKGHVNRHLRGLRFRDGRTPPSGATLEDDTGKPVGEVRTTAASPRLGAIALGMVRREVEPGATLTVRWDEREGRAEMCALPFPTM